ncbi:CAP domain-containing protein [Rapidithrix thailandica]|uniref:CAP domain-containing protein n=1 Tax=Rapidithrix thailandica TaxID=413964 RepID=A0AAW9S6X4_9BACT
MNRYKLLVFIPFVFLLMLTGCLSDSDPDPDGRSALDVETLNLINQYRKAKSLPLLKHSLVVYEQARIHSQNMADHNSPFGHSGYNFRLEQIKKFISVGIASELVAFNAVDNPAFQAYDTWVNDSTSKSHLDNSRYSHAGLAAVNSFDGRFYFTLILIQEKQ